MTDDDKKPAADSLEEQPGVIEPQQPESPAKTVGETELSGAGSAPSVPHRRSLRRFLRFSNLYLVIFILMVVVAAIGVFAAIKLTDDGSDEPSKAQSLTEQQLAELKGSTTVIGDSQQILDIQSNAVFENQVLMRGNLDVAGTVKVGGPLSLSAVSVGGTSSFGRVQINDALTVAGSTTLQSLTVAGTASFNGTLSVSKLSVNNFTITGDLGISRHIAGSGGTPTRTNGSALGGGGTASVSGSDTAGTVTINTGSGPPAGCFATINFAVSFGSTPHVVISPSNSSSASLDYYTNRSTSSFSVCTSSTPSASTTYLFDYHVFD